MKSKRITVIASALLLFVNSSFAGLCGIGVVSDLYAGGWDTNDIIFKLNDPTNKIKSTTMFDGDKMRVVPIGQGNSSNTENRQDRIFSLLLSSLLTGQEVRAFTHLNSCSSITEVNGLVTSTK